MKVESVKQTIEPQFIDPILNELGHRDGAGIGNNVTKVSVTGEAVYTTSALIAPFIPQFSAAVAIANVTTAFESTGGLYMTSIELTKDRGSWHKVSAEFESYADQT